VVSNQVIPGFETAVMGLNVGDKTEVTIEPEQEKWIKKKLDEHKYYNRSHIIQEAIRLLQEKESG